MMFPFDARYLEVQNGIQTLLGVLILVTFGYYLLTEMARSNWTRTRIRAATAIMVYVGGETGVRAWIWWWRHLENNHIDTAWMNQYPALIVFGITSIAGAFCVARVFSPDGWGSIGWIAGVIVAVGIAVAVAI